MEKDLVSIIMPAYNSSRYIEESISTVIYQTVSNWELIIVDDNSSDNTAEIVQFYINKDSRFKMIQNNKNMGVAEARNIGISIAKGRYIAFLDSDDKWKEDKLEKQISFMQKYNYAFTFTSYEYITDNSSKCNKIIKVPSYIDYRRGLKNTIIGCLTVIVDKSITGEFYMPNLKHGEDYITWLNLMKNGVVAFGLDECLAEYRIGQKSLSSNKFKALRNQWNNYRNVCKLSIPETIYFFGCYLSNAVLKRL